MPSNNRLGSLALAALLFLVIAGCGSNDDESDTATSSTSTPSTPSTQPTTTETTVSSTSTAETSTSTTGAPSTTEPQGSFAITYVCGNGDTGSADIPTEDIDEIDDIVNTIDLCETLGGLTEITFTAPCPSGDREWPVGATDGALPDFATIDFCENET